MTTNLVELIQKNLQYPALHKVDPNLQDIKNKETDTLELLAQAAIPAVLTGLYKLSRNDEGSTSVMIPDRIEDALGVIFKGKETQVVEKIARYAGVSPNQAESHLENISDESIRLVKEIIPGKKEPRQLKHFMNDQRHNILVYLPAELQMGDLLKDETLDDRTNKMEGPVSNFMHKIENILSQGGE
ncbi:MAG TPA: hypothetical protein VGO58_12790 [Chitinophagaceae bacterium]|jgi:hypothetical protein|nr:hypothetical protein [Chitinophagaceae bacterium]